MTNDNQLIDSFIFYRSFFEAIKYLPKENKAEIYDAICEFALNGNITEFDNPISSGFMHLIKPQLIANQRKRENGLKGAEYGKLGGRPKKKENPKETPKKPLNNPKGTPNVNVNVNVNDECIIDNAKDKNIIINNNIPDFINLEIWNDFINMRKLIKKPATERAKTNLIKKLTDFYTEGIDPNECLNNSITNNWQDIFKPKNGASNEKNLGNKFNGFNYTTGGGKPSIGEAVERTLENIKNGSF